MVAMFEDQTEDAEVVIDWNGNDIPAGVQAEGDWDGAIITFKVSYNDGKSYLAPLNAVFEEDEIVRVSVATGKIKAILSGAGAGTRLSFHISPG